ncbi:hypothetical protein XD13_10030 [Staphylococcus aureus]|uniref:Uncharacterized protein n=1 Tax=Staphylococcus aureus TaxID=1280 RepID=A0AAP8CQ66_STAAU|nr:hypothetical protein ACH32_11125 [Staphylococcus aureus]OFL40248.1 hypothetical protein HMPREF2770_03020 [Staphylococcus sp. HMSC075C08]OHP03693.1 hypothetical protein HMPREF2671_00580 [Staphylococcus sp. HMSC058E01]OHP78835.1 hypothetical protein HMPREF2658_01125 [Staphylococcus sp. HMSC062H10]OHQ00432.1 hypothetical protein HMPREF2733_09830 [Staphylococcus sp. HMSC063H12]OHS71277.1 hypothetical protein HMPREF3285_04360 [Staphylococcus sp. HMSC74F04]OHS79796.1 hypothetical protein HMPREF3
MLNKSMYCALSNITFNEFQCIELNVENVVNHLQ